MTTDNTAPTQPRTDPVTPDDQETLRRESSPAPMLGDGHWYSFPGQQPLAQPPSDPIASPLPLRGRPQTARDRVRRRKVRRESGVPDDWAWVIIAAALLGMTVVMSLTVFVLIQATRGPSGTVATSGPALEPTSILYGPGGILAGDAGVAGMLGGQSMVIQPWDGKERFTVLLMGMDQRPGEFGANLRTDTMIVISLDPKTNSVGMLSIPRDIFVDVPGYGPERINAAYGIGELSGPGGGPQLAIQTVQYNFGIRVNEFVTVNFDLFIKVIDLVGGINVEVKEAIYDPEYPDMNYGYDPFYIDAGWQSLDGRTALKYARSRHASDDIDRNRRQQQVLLALRDRVTAMNMIPQLAPRAYELWAEMSKDINTGLSLDQILQLAWWAKDIPTTNYRNGVVGWEYVIPTVYGGRDVLIPNRDAVIPLLIEVFGPDYNQ